MSKPATSDKVWTALNEQREAVGKAGAEAYSASSKANASGEEADHLDAAKAHEDVFKKAAAVGLNDVAKEHASAAASHEDAAKNPSSPAFRSRVAKEASKDAWAKGTSEAHEAAAAAHGDAADAHKAKSVGDSWQARQHAGDAKAHEWAAARMPSAKDK